MGFCMGGRADDRCRGAHPGHLSRGVCFYGIPPKEFADSGEDQDPVPGAFRQSGRLVHPGLRSISSRRALQQARASYEIYRYDAAHAFFNERSAAYDLASANQAWGTDGRLSRKAAV